MSKLPPKPKKAQGVTREDWLKLEKNELVDKIIQLQTHNLQLKNIISKSLDAASKKEDRDKSKNFNFDKCSYRRVLLRFLYFGWDYQGLAVQEDTSQTIEHYLFQALTKSCLIEKRETSQYNRCGRTDKGVSAFGQVISINLRSKYEKDQQSHPESISSEMPYCKILNRLLPKAIRAVAWMPIPDDKSEYSARFDCKKRQYKYYFPRSNLNIESMRSACKHLLGSNDYRNLCKMDVGNGVTEFWREIFAADIIPVEGESDSPTSMYYLLIEGNAFLWHQIRCIMGVLLLVGQDKEDSGIFCELLDVEKYPRKPQYNMALDVPLNLFHCSYDLEEEQKWIYDRDDLRTVISHFQNEWTVQNIKSTMIKDTITKLETEYETICESETADCTDEKSDRDKITVYTNCLTHGVKPRTYTPLLKRDTCSSLEERIEYHMKKRKLVDVKEEDI